jgi:ABC-type transport system substrate-binding protein
MQAMMRAVGVELSMKGEQASLLFAPASAGGILESGAFDIEWSGFFAADDPDNSHLFSCAARAPKGNNTSRWCNPDFERWTRVALTHYDRPTRWTAYSHIEHDLLDDVPEIFVWWPRDLQLHSVDLHGLSDGRFMTPAYRWSI